MVFTPSPERSLAYPTMSTPPAGSPANGMQLTPRSKIQALLGAFDSDSDKENLTIKTTTKAKFSTHSPLQSRHLQQSPRKSHGLSGEDSSEDELIAPSLGANTVSGQRKIDRMQLEEDESMDAQDHSDKSDDVSDGAGAYERIRKQLSRRTPAITRPVDSPRGIPEISHVSEHRDASAQHSRPASRAASPNRRVDELAEPTGDDAEGMESDVSSTQVAGKSRFQELIAKKRAQREALEKAIQHSSEEEEEEEMPLPRPAPKNPKRQAVIVESEDDSEAEAGRRFTQQARPTKKASKKAVEEMHRETQRMSRNMQLTHEARTKKKFTTADLFKKLNFRQPKIEENLPLELQTHSGSSAPVTSDAEPVSESHTPPSSPPSLGEEVGPKKRATEMQNILPAVTNDASDDELPSREQVLAGNSRSSPAPISRQHRNTDTEMMAARLSMRKFGKSVQVQAQDDSDDDLEIIEPTKPSRIAVLDNMPAKKADESQSLRSLRALAHLNGSGEISKRLKGSMTPGELGSLLHRRAREQAQIEKSEKIRVLREKGIFVQTDEEKEKEQMQIESMLERARQEAEELRKREKEAAKREGRDDGAVDGLSNSDDEDEDYDGSDEDADVELSGSEEEDEEEGEEGERGDEDIASNRLLDDQANEDDGEEEEQDEAQEEDVADAAESEDEPVPRQAASRVRRKAIVDSDDEDEPAVKTPAKAMASELFETPKPSLSDAFGFGKVQSPALGLSQVFGGTMAETQTQGESTLPTTDSQQDSLAFLRGLPPPDMSSFGGGFDDEVEGVMVEDSQNRETEKQTDSPAQDSPLFSIDSLTQHPFPESQSEQPDPTQDEGFETMFSPLRGQTSARQDGPHSTVDTVLLEPDSPEMRKKGRLRRGREQVEVEASQNEANALASEVDQPKQSTNVFMVMKNATKKPAPEAAFDKKKSNAKEMVEDQAEESDDEYAGLGGLDDDASDGELDEETKKMIDDESNEKVNERDVAAYYADKERADDEKLLTRLYKDINNGGFRRKRGADMDLLDSDDEEEAMTRRRAAKQREFAKMRKALLADEKLGKIAENPKQQAFLQAIEDHANEDEFMFLDQPEDGASQSSASEGPLRSTNGDAGKSKHSDMAGDESEGAENRPPSHMRRTHKAFKAVSLADVRNTLSEIIGESESALDSQLDALSDREQASDDDDLTVEKPAVEESRGRTDSPALGAVTSPPNPRRTAAPSRTAVIDRMALKRASSSSASNTGERLAFQAPSRANTGSFKVPSLLRRATTNASTVSSDSTSDKSVAAGTGKEMVKMGGSTKSSVNYYVREKERRAKVEELGKVREEARLKVGRMRRNGKGLGSLTGGSFE